MILRPYCRILKFSPPLQRKYLVIDPLQRRAAATYEGDGKTTAKVLNKDLDFLMVNAISNVGFLLNTGFRVLGPLILFPRTFLSWNVSGISDVNEKSLSLLTVLCPKIELLVLGYGDHQAMSKEQHFKMKTFCDTHKIGCEALPTENAVATFNYLNHERRLVVGAFIPPTKIKMYDDDDIRAFNSRELLLSEEEQSFINK